MQYGDFDDKAKEYVITRPDTPQSWSNAIVHLGQVGGESAHLPGI
jgi:cellobiose phosphorylase